MDFAVLPPEINSARMFSGAGSGPLFMAAAAWGGLAAELQASASSFDLVIEGLVAGPWSGPASATMSAAAVPYVGWLSAAAGEAELAANQARAAATMFETASAATVHPAAVAANRASLLSLLATNFLGQNTPAIAATEFEYVEMWAQDVAAMVGYQSGATSVAATLAPFGLPPMNMTDLLSQVGAVVSGLASEVQTLSALAPVSTLMSASQAALTPASMAMSPMMSLMSNAMRGGPPVASASEPMEAATKFVGAAAPKMTPLGGGLPVSAGAGQARMVGAMSVPPTWAGSTPAQMTSSALMGFGGIGRVAPESAAGMPATGGGIPMMPMPAAMGAGAGGVPAAMMSRGGAGAYLVQNRPSVIPRAGVG